MSLAPAPSRHLQPTIAAPATNSRRLAYSFAPGCWAHGHRGRDAIVATAASTRTITSVEIPHVAACGIDSVNVPCVVRARSREVRASHMSLATAARKPTYLERAMCRRRSPTPCFQRLRACQECTDVLPAARMEWSMLTVLTDPSRFPMLYRDTLGGESLQSTCTSRAHRRGA